jgi:hypothetical protein
VSDTSGPDGGVPVTVPLFSYCPVIALPGAAVHVMVKPGADVFIELLNNVGKNSFLSLKKLQILLILTKIGFSQ